jgi:acyl-CoA thioester hydrolase
LRTDTGAMFVVADTSVRYFSPARLDDELRVTVRVVEAGRASMTLSQQAWRHDVLLAQGSIRIGCVDAGTFKPRRIPSELLEAIP